MKRWIVDVVYEYRALPVCTVHDFMTFSWLSGRGGSAGGKFRISLALPVGAVINCADNTGVYVRKLLLQFTNKEMICSLQNNIFYVKI